jgi:hypothetical protein
VQQVQHGGSCRGPGKPAECEFKVSQALAALAQVQTRLLETARHSPATLGPQQLSTPLEGKFSPTYPRPYLSASALFDLIISLEVSSRDNRNYAETVFVTEHLVRARP